jgi:hypothetical protein
VPQDDFPAIRSAVQIDLAARGRPRQRGWTRHLSKWRVVTAFTMAGVVFLGSGFLALSIADFGGPAGALSPLAWVHDRRSERLTGDGRRPTSDVLRAETESWTALAQDPVDDEAWLQLAYADHLQHPSLTPRALSMLQRSYDVAPLGPDTSMARIRFGLENWGELTPELRKEVADEIRATAGRSGADVQQLGSEIHNPTGRMVASLVLIQVGLDKHRAG